MSVRSHGWRYGSVRILRDGSVRYHSRVFPGLPWLSFFKTDDLHVEIDGRAVLYLLMEQEHVVRAVFTSDLTPADLRHAVNALEGAGRGLERWIIPALEDLQAELSGKEWGKALFRAIPEVLSSVRHLPVAEQWRKRHPASESLRKRSRRSAKWYGSVRILRDDRVRLMPVNFSDFSHIAVWGSMSKVSIFCSGVEVLLLFLERKRVLSTCFVYTLEPDQLRKAVMDLRQVRGGLERWIVPALEWNQADSGFRRENPDAHRIIPELLGACRALPVAESWQRRRRETQREWAKHLREQPEDIVKITAPWMLPSGFTLPEPSKDARRAAKTTRRPSRK